MLQKKQILGILHIDAQKRAEIILDALRRHEARVGVPQPRARGPRREQTASGLGIRRERPAEREAR